MCIRDRHQGVRGVAWATVISQTISAVLCMVYMFKKYPILRFNRKEAAADGKIMGEILRIGIPLGLTNALLAVGMMVVTGVVNSFGSDIVAVYLSLIHISSYDTVIVSL